MGQILTVVKKKMSLNKGMWELVHVLALTESLFLTTSWVHMYAAYVHSSLSKPMNPL